MYVKFIVVMENEKAIVYFAVKYLLIILLLVIKQVQQNVQIEFRKSTYRKFLYWIQKKFYGGKSNLSTILFYNL